MINYAPETCAFCEGKAAEFWRKEAHYVKCPICKGIGSVLVAQPARQCAFCDGACDDFWRDGNHYQKCPVCKRVGWAHISARQ